MDTKEQSLYTDSHHETMTDLEASNINTAHLTNHDPWYQVGFVLVTFMSSAYALGYSKVVMVPLGWVGGTMGLVAVAAISLYANHLLARLHETGGIRHIRYRDLAGHIYGKKMYYVTWTLQYISLFMINAGYIILAGQALKAMYTTYSNEFAFKLPYSITIAGIVCTIFAFAIPHLSALKLWLGVSTVSSLIYIVVAIGLSIKDGVNSPAKDYEMPGSKENKFFNWVGAVASLVFAYNSGMLPEIQAMYTTYSNEFAFKLPYSITIAGIVCTIFAFAIPHLSALKLWLGVSTVSSLIYIVVAIGLSIKDGVNSPAKDYEMAGSKENKFFNSVGAVASLVFAYNSGMLPEIQATVKHPHVKNMQKALYLQFTAGIVPFYAVTLVGYWAYGSETSSYLLNNVHGPKWIKAMANAAAFLQSVISQHIFANPVYEYLDTKFERSNESVYSAHNRTVRFLARGTYLAATTFMAALLPFLGDFISITGALSTIPLTFVLANHMYIKVKGNDLSSLSKTWHWANIWLFAILAAAATVASVRFILVDSKTYSAFADF